MPNNTLSEFYIPDRTAQVNDRGKLSMVRVISLEIWAARPGSFFSGKMGYDLCHYSIVYVKIQSPFILNVQTQHAFKFPSRSVVFNSEPRRIFGHLRVRTTPSPILVCYLISLQSAQGWPTAHRQSLRQGPRSLRSLAPLPRQSVGVRQAGKPGPRQ